MKKTYAERKATSLRPGDAWNAAFFQCDKDENGETYACCTGVRREYPGLKVPFWLCFSTKPVRGGIRFVPKKHLSAQIPEWTRKEFGEGVTLWWWVEV